MGSRPLVSTCSARLRLCLWERSALVRRPFPSPLATFPDLSLGLLLQPSGGPPRLPTRVSLPTTLARGKQLSRSPLETFPDLSLAPPLLPNGGPPRLPTRVSLPTMLARGRLLSRSPLETSPDLSLDLKPPVSGGPTS